MSLREKDVSDPAVTRRAQMVRVVLMDEAIFAVWRVPKRAQAPEEQRIELGPALTANLFGRVPFQTMLDNIATDTQDRIET